MGDSPLVQGPDPFSLLTDLVYQNCENGQLAFLLLADGVTLVVGDWSGA